MTLDVAITTAFGAASALVVGLSCLAFLRDRERHVDTLGISIVLFLTWAVSASATHMGHTPDSWTIYPVMDAVFGTLVMAAWWSQRAAWKLCLVASLVVECILHLAFWLQPPSVRENDGTKFLYTLGLDILFSAQLLSNGAPGALDVASRAGLRLFGGPRRHRAVVSRP